MGSQQLPLMVKLVLVKILSAPAVVSVTVPLVSVDVSKDTLVMHAVSKPSWSTIGQGSPQKSKIQVPRSTKDLRLQKVRIRRPRQVRLLQITEGRKDHCRWPQR